MDQTRSNVKSTSASSSSSPRSNYENITDEEFKKHLLVGKDKTHFELVYFILNTLHHICDSGHWYCYCENRRGKCKMCKIPKIFTNFMKDIENNIFDYKFLLFYYTKLTKELFKLIDHHKKRLYRLLFEWARFQGVEITLLLLLGVFLFLKAFDTLKKFKLVD